MLRLNSKPGVLVTRFSATKTKMFEKLLKEIEKTSKKKTLRLGWCYESPFNSKLLSLAQKIRPKFPYILMDHLCFEVRNLLKANFTDKQFVVYHESGNIRVDFMGLEV